MNQNPGREEELIGGIKNALERGYDIVSAQKSFVNAGYSVEEVSIAAQKASSNSIISRPINQNSFNSPPTNQNYSSFPISNFTRPKKSKTLIWLLSIFSALILITALLLSFYWDKFF